MCDGAYDMLSASRTVANHHVLFVVLDTLIKQCLNVAHRSTRFRIVRMKTLKINRRNSDGIN